MPRQALPPGVWGSITTRTLPSGATQASANYRRVDGSYGRAKRSASTRAGAIRALQSDLPATVQARATVDGHLTRDSRFTALCELAIAELHMAEHLAPSYRHELERLIAGDLIPSFGKLRIREVAPSMVHSRHTKLVRTTPGKARMWRVAAMRVFDTAIQLDLADSNIARTATKAPRRARKEIHAPNPLELNAFRDLITAYRERPDRNGPRPSRLLDDVVDVILATSARIGEALGLRIQDIDLASEIPTVTINGAVKEGHGMKKEYSAKPKTDASRRRVPVPDEVVPLLRSRIEAARVAGTVFLFHTKSGAPNGPQDVHRALRNVREWAGLPEQWIPHALRKAVATAIAHDEFGGVASAASVLGHRGLDVTELHYVKPAAYASDQRRTLSTLARKAP